MSKALVPKKNAPDWDQIVELWLHGRPSSTQEIYKPVVEHFRLTVSKPIAAVTLKDLQDYANEFIHQKPRTINRKLCTIKSLLTFAQKIGVIPFNVGGALRLPKIPSDLAERILDVDQILKMIETEPDKRNRVLLRLLYASGVRASEAAGLRWIDLDRRPNGAGQVTVLGKGSKTRSILLSVKTWKALLSIKPKDAKPEMYVFTREDSDEPIDRTRIAHIVREAAQRAGIERRVSPHSMRHCHATHALDNGAPLILISQTLGHKSIDTTTRYLHVRPGQSSATSLGV